MSQYRVDRVDSRTVPCGMNSILYLGDNWNAAMRVFSKAETGLDAWKQPNPAYGDVLSSWRGQRLTGDYVIQKEKGL